MVDEAAMQNVIRAAEQVFHGASIFLAYAHGSQIAGRATKGSDLDIGYYLEGYLQEARLPISDEMVLEDRLAVATGYDVDLRNLGLAPLELKGRVLEEGVRIYCSDERRRVNLERDLLGRYHDYKDTFAAMHVQRLNRFAQGV